MDTKDTDRLFERGFPKNALNSEKINFDIRCLSKTFHFRDIHPSSKKMLKFWHFVSQWAPIRYSSNSIHNSIFFKEQ